MANQPDPWRPNRPPDGYAIIDKEGRIMGGENIPLKIHQVIFDCLASYQDYKAIKKTIFTANPGAPAHAQIRLHHKNGCTSTALIRVDPLPEHRHILAGWHIPNSLTPHRFTKYAIC